MIDGAHIVLLPGLDGTGRLFRWLAANLNTDVRTIAVRYPVDQRLPVTDLATLVLQQTPPEPFVIVAESYSGMVGLAVAARHPANLRGLILSTAFVKPPVPSLLRFAPLDALLQLRPPQIALRLFLLEERTPPEIVADVRNAIHEVYPGILGARLREVLTRDSRDALRACSVPIVYLAASGDRLIGLRALRTIQRLKPEIESVTLDGPHLLLQARPDEAAAVIKRYARHWLST